MKFKLYYPCYARESIKLKNKCVSNLFSSISLCSSIFSNQQDMYGTFRSHPFFSFSIGCRCFLSRHMNSYNFLKDLKYLKANGAKTFSFCFGQEFEL